MTENIEITESDIYYDPGFVQLRRGIKKGHLAIMIGKELHVYIWMLTSAVNSGKNKGVVYFNPEECAKDLNTKEYYVNECVRSLIKKNYISLIKRGSRHALSVYKIVKFCKSTSMLGQTSKNNENKSTYMPTCMPEPPSKPICKPICNLDKQLNLNGIQDADRMIGREVDRNTVESVKKVVPEQRQATDFFCNKFKEDFTDKYDFKKADGVIIDRLLKNSSLETFKKKVLSLSNEFKIEKSKRSIFQLKDKDRYTSGVLSTIWNMLDVNKTQEQPVVRYKKYDLEEDMKVINPHGLK